MAFKLKKTLNGATSVTMRCYLETIIIRKLSIFEKKTIHI